MDAFDDISAEFASTSCALLPMAGSSKRERSARAVAPPTGRLPAAQTSSEFAQAIVSKTPILGLSERERSASSATSPMCGLPAAHSSASTVVRQTPIRDASKRRRQAIVGETTKKRVPAGEPIQKSESRNRPDDHGSHALGDGGGARPSCDIHYGTSPAAVQNSEGHSAADTLAGPTFGSDEGAQIQTAPRDWNSPLVAEITALWRMRQRWHRAEKSLTLQGKAVCRSWTEGDKDAANALFAKAAKGEAADPTLGMALMPFLSAIEKFETERGAIEKRLRKLSQASPLWPWVAEIKGFGSLNLAAIIGEAGEIAGYRNPSCLWKRMGLAVIDGGRQRRVADAEKAVAHGYAPQRRCVAYLLGDTLIKSGDACRYRPVYAARREHTATTHPDWTKGHSHNDAARYMVKRVLRELWSEARRLEREVRS